MIIKHLIHEKKGTVMSDRKPLNCTDTEYQKIYELLEWREGTRSARKEFIKSIHDNYEFLHDINFFNAFKQIFEIICKKEFHDLYCELKNANVIHKDTSEKYQAYVKRICRILSENHVYEITREDIESFLHNNDISSSYIKRYIHTYPEMTTYAHFIEFNDLGYDKEYFTHALESVDSILFLNKQAIISGDIE
jgi:hypothetical protein